MRTFPSRSEKRENQLVSAAKRGELSLERVILYPSEIKKLEKDGFVLSDVKPANIPKKSLFVANVDWASAYSDGIPHKVYSYINRQIDELPKDEIHNFAEELFVTALRNFKD